MVFQIPTTRSEFRCSSVRGGVSGLLFFAITAIGMVLHFWVSVTLAEKKTAAQPAKTKAAAEKKEPEKAPPKEEVLPEKKYSKAVMIPFEGFIGTLMQHFLYRKLEEAKELGADLVILKVDSPGGGLIVSLDIAKKLRYIDWATTVAYVPKDAQAISGGAIISLGCDEIVMHPDVQIGNAGAIYVTRDGVVHKAKEKIASYAKQVKDLAVAKNRPPAVAEAMMDNEVEIFKAENKKTGETTYFSKKEIERLENREDWNIRETSEEESVKEHYLMVNGIRAVELKLAQGTVEDDKQLFARYNLENPPTLLGMRWVDTMVFFLNLPFITFLLILAGLICLYVEFSVPGIGLGGILATACFMLFFWSRFLGGTADMLELLLFLGGIVCLALELFVIPGFGVAGLSGILLILTSIILASQTFVIPETSLQMQTFTTSLAVMGGASAVFAVSVFYINRHFGTLPLLNRLTVMPPSPEASQDEQPEGPLVEVGQRGIAHTALRPSGKARFGDQYINVVVEDDIVRQGSKIEVVEVSAHRILVIPVLS